MARKLSDSDVERLRELWAEGWSAPDLAAEFGISRQHVGRLVREEQRPTIAGLDAGRLRSSVAGAVDLFLVDLEPGSVDVAMAAVARTLAAKLDACAASETAAAAAAIPTFVLRAGRGARSLTHSRRTGAEQARRASPASRGATVGRGGGIQRPSDGQAALARRGSRTSIYTAVSPVRWRAGVGSRPLAAGRATDFWGVIGMSFSRAWSAGSALASGRGRAVGVLAATAGLLGLWAVGLPGSGLASTRFGSNLTANANLGFICVNGPCVYTFANTSLPLGAPPLTSPVTGTIVRWRLKTHVGSSGTMQLRVLAPAGGGQFSGAGTGPSEDVPSTGTTTPFSVQLPIAAGDSIGVDAALDGANDNFFAFGSAQAGAVTGSWLPSLADGGTTAPNRIDANVEFLLNADVAALPTSSVAIPVCTTTGTLAATVTPDPDPAVAAKAIHFRIDGGPEQTQATSGNPGNATIPVPNGSHMLESWGEDSVGGLESPHHTATVVGCAATPGGTTPGGTTSGSTTTAGGTTAGTTPPPSPAAAATISELSQTNAVFRVGPQATPLTGSTARSLPRGTTFSFRLDQPAVVTVLIQRQLPGRRVGRVCKRPTHGLRKRPRCTRLVTKATLQRNATIGLNQIPFSGRIGRRALAPGRYRAAFTAGTSSPSALSFRIAR